MIDKLEIKIANILEVSVDALRSSENFLDFEKFDSLAQIQIAAVLDSDFGCAIDPEEFELLVSIDSIINLTNLS